MDSIPIVSDDFIENRIFDEIMVGDTASIVHTLTSQDIELFAIAPGDVNPPVLSPDLAETAMCQKVVAHGVWGGGLISAVLGTKLPGPGTIYRSQEFQFHGQIGPGDTITASVVVLEKMVDRLGVCLACRCVNQDGLDVITGTAEVQAPTVKLRQARPRLPEVRLNRHRLFRELLRRAAGSPAIAVAVVHPCDALSMSALAEVAELGLVRPILVGPLARLHAAAVEAGIDISRYRLVDVPHSHAAAEQAVALVRAGEAAMLMKGSLHTDELMHAVVAHDTGLRTARRLSHVYVMDVPDYPRPLLITDAAINIAPDLETKRDIVQNAIDLAHIIGVKMPRVAIVCATETVNPSMPSTLAAAALCKMADRGQITGALVDGPLAFDNAVDPEAARQKGILSPVAGYADIIVTPDIEAGNMLAKQLSFLADADAAGVVVGARVPIILTSRADSIRSRVASCALAVLMARANLRTLSLPAPSP